MRTIQYCPIVVHLRIDRIVDIVVDKDRKKFENTHEYRVSAGGHKRRCTKHSLQLSQYLTSDPFPRRRDVASSTKSSAYIKTSRNGRRLVSQVMKSISDYNETYRLCSLTDPFHKVTEKIPFVTLDGQSIAYMRRRYKEG